MNILKRNQKDAFYFEDYAVAIMVGVGLFILPFLGEFHFQKKFFELSFSVGTIHFVIRKCSKLEKEPNFYITVQIIESDNDDAESV